MRLVAGNYGADGKVTFDGNAILLGGHLVGRSQIKSMTARQHSERGFSLTVLLGGLFVLVPFFGIVAGFFFGAIIGALAAIATFIITLFGCFDYVESRLVSVQTADGKTFTVQCSKKEADRLMTIAP